jgi:hypothetical protein
LEIDTEERVIDIQYGVYRMLHGEVLPDLVGVDRILRFPQQIRIIGRVPSV